MKRINLYLPEELIQRLHAQAAEQGSTFSALTREILEGYAKGAAPAASACDRGVLEERLERIERMLFDESAHLKDLKAVLDLVLHFARRSAER
jgi:plasmid stability protein